MSDSLWIDDVKIVLLTDSAIEAMDIVDLARVAGRGSTLLVRKPHTLISLLKTDECKPHLAILGGEISDEDAKACIDAAKAANTRVILIDQPEHATYWDRCVDLSRPFGVQDLRVAFKKAGVPILDS